MNKKYGTMIIDPPWKYSNRQNGAAEKHYPLMTYKELAAMPIPSVAANDSVLLMWATWPQLDVAMKLINDWGFNYVTGMPWIKLQEHPIADLFSNIVMVPTFGTGHWLRGCSEPILIARRGKPRLPKNVPLGLLSKRLEHSRKPESLHEYAEQLDGPYLEIFARRAHDGWDVFGNEVADSVKLEEIKD